MNHFKYHFIASQTRLIFALISRKCRLLYATIPSCGCAVASWAGPKRGRPHVASSSENTAPASGWQGPCCPEAVGCGTRGLGAKDQPFAPVSVRSCRFRPMRRAAITSPGSAIGFAIGLSPTRDFGRAAARRSVARKKRSSAALMARRSW